MTQKKWAKENNKPSYIQHLFLSTITVSVETIEIVKGLPKLEFGEESEEDKE